MYGTGWENDPVSVSRGVSRADSSFRRQEAEKEERFANFIRTFRRNASFVYRCDYSLLSTLINSDQLRRNYNLKQYFLDIRKEDLNSFDPELDDELSSRPHEFLLLVRSFALNFC